MAGWSDLLTTSLQGAPKKVFICCGELSALVWDRVHAVLTEYELVITVRSAEDLMYAGYYPGVKRAYVVVDPNETIISKIDSLVRGGDDSSFYILFTADIPDSAEYLKKKAQHYKQYYTIVAPRSEAARSKLVSFFKMRWGVTSDQAMTTCSTLDFSPGRLYLFDTQYMILTGGAMLPSIESKSLIHEIIGTDFSKQVASMVLSGEAVDDTFDSDFNFAVLGFLENMLDYASAIKEALRQGATTVSAVRKATGLTQFSVVQAWWLAQEYSADRLHSCRNSIDFGYKYARNNDMLMVLSRIWGSI